MFWSKERKLKSFRSKAGNLYTHPEMYAVEKDYAYDLYARSQKGNPDSQFQAYNHSKAMKEIDNQSLDEVVSTIILEKAVLSAFNYGEVREATRNRFPAEAVVLSGDEELEVNLDKVVGKYVAVVDSGEKGIPVKFELATFIAGDIESVSSISGEEFDVADLLGDGIEIETDFVGQAILLIEFDEDVDKSGVLTASIDEGHALVDSSDDDTLTIVVNTEAGIYVEATDPEDGAVDVPIDADIVVTFDVDIADNSGATPLTDIITITGEGAPSWNAFDITGNVLTLDVDGTLINNEEYVVTVPIVDSVKSDDTREALLKEELVITFTTVEA